MKVRLFLVLLLSVVIAGGAVFAAGEAEEDVRTLRLAHNHSGDTHASLGYEFFAERVNELTDGEITIEIFGDSVLGDSREVMEQIQAGALAMTHISAGFASSFVPVYDVFAVPYVFRSQEHFWNVLTGPVGEDIASYMEDENIKQLFWVDSGARSFYNAERPVETPEDVAGLQIRVMGSPVMMDFVEALDGTPTTTAFAEVYNALQTGVIDGAENNPISVQSMAHYEVVDYYSLNEHMRIPDMLLMSLDVWKSLTPSQQEAFEEAALETQDFIREEFAAQRQEALEIIATNTEINEFDDLGPFVEATAPLREELKGQFDGMLERIEEVD